MKWVVTIIIIFSSFVGFSQNLSSQDVLDKAINYHDPNGNWDTFNNEFTVVMTTPSKPKRKSKIHINLPLEYFYINAKQDSISYEYSVNKGSCSTSSLNVEALKELDSISNKALCDKAFLYKNYYTYLYGLPMKLKDAGTNLSDTVEQKTFNGKDYLVLKVTYDETVGSDVWYFYFDPKTYAMEIYQFFKTDINGKEKPDSGEYILLTEETVISDIKMPKVRAWYYNKDDSYLGTDTLVKG